MDFISAFMEHTKGTPTADIYRLWSAISCISGALERRVWTTTLHEPIFPNIFVLLVGGPGAGKTPSITPVRRLWKTNPKLAVTADSLTKAGFFDALESASKKIPAGGQFIEYSSLIIAADEFGMFMSAYDKDFASSLAGAYDGRDIIGEQRRHSLGVGRKRADVVNPLVTILAGSQPGFMTSLFTDEVWEMGFTARMILVYSGERHTPKLTFGRNGPEQERKESWKKLSADIARFSKMIGEFTWEPNAELELDRWVGNGCYPEPEHSKLKHYNAKRGVHVAKLAMISTISRGDSTVITLRDLERARNWLLHAETVMPNVFREMKGKSDHQVIEEIYILLWSDWAKHKKPIHESKILSYIGERTLSHNVTKMLELIERMGIVSRDAGTKLYIPRPRHLHGME